MKFIIEESRLNKLITKYLDENLGDLNYNFHFDEHGNEDDSALVFYLGDYIDEDVFRYYKPSWWNKDASYNAYHNWEKSPMIIFENSPIYHSLQGFFGDEWKEVFKKWFETNFGYPVKTIEY